MSKNILFRADSSSIIGTGHIMRDLVLSDSYHDSHIIFATQDLAGNINHKINYKTVTLESNDLDELISIVKEHEVDMLVIDHYDIDWEFEKKIKEKTGVKILSFDDTYERHHCDILLNHNIYADKNKYIGLVPKDCEIRCGGKYTLIRDEFKVEKDKSKSFKIQNSKFKIFIAMGGTDSANLNINILEVLQNFLNIHACVITTTANKYLTQLKEYVSEKKNITLHINTSQVAKLMKECDFAIVTPSVTLHEVIYMDIPFIAIQSADNQREMVEYLLQNRYSVVKFFDEKFLYKNIEKLFIEMINFIDLTFEEKKMVLEWRNNDNIRKWMIIKEKIELENHLKFIDILSSRVDKKYFLVKQNGKAIGVIDFTNINQSSTEFGLYTNPNLRRIGKVLMNLILDYAFETLKVQKLIAYVSKDNSIAIKLYYKYGFKEIDSQEMICMELQK